MQKDGLTESQNPSEQGPSEESLPQHWLSPAPARNAIGTTMQTLTRMQTPAKTRADQRSARALTGWIAVAGGAMVGAGLLLEALQPRADGIRPIRSAQLAGWGAALLASSVLVDSAMEHYKGSYQKPQMAIAPPVAAITLAAAISAALSVRFGRLKTLVFTGAIATGLVGTGFHTRNILHRTGGLSFNNVFYRAPFGAPGALALAGAGGLASVLTQRLVTQCTKVDGQRCGAEPAGNATQRVVAGRAMALLTATGLFGLTAEVGLLHFRGSFHNPLMWAPVLFLPTTGLGMLAARGNTAWQITGLNRWVARALGCTSTLAIAGTGLHAWGVSRGMGGWRNWTQNLFAGPPIAAPPSLAGIALLGFSALNLLRVAEGDTA